jgi:Rieske 2Fe-2S family protein
MPEDFDKRQFGLHRCHVRIVEGLIFLCLAEEPPDFEPVFRDIEVFLGPHGLADAKVCHRSTHLVQANWKLVAENFWECYHCTHTHPEFCSVMSYAHAADSEALAREQEAFRAEWEAYAHSLGHRTGRTEAGGVSTHHAVRLPIRRGYLTQSQDGRPVAPLMGSFRQYDGGISAVQAYPLIWFVASNDHALLSRFTPLGPTRTEAELTWLVRAGAVEGVDYDVERVTWLWSRTGAEDWKICEDNQAGVNSRRYRPGPYSSTETGARDFVAWYLKQLSTGT